MSSLMPILSSRSLEPDLLETERLPCLATFRPQAAATSAEVVETLMVLRPSPPVPTMSQNS